MTFFDLHPIDPYEARFKVIAALILLSELGVIEQRKELPVWAPAPDRGRSLRRQGPARGGTRLVRPPRSC